MIISDEFGRNQNRAIPGPKNSNSSRDVRVYIARYEYNPYEGPNPCPEVELYLHAGKNIIVKLWSWHVIKITFISISIRYIFDTTSTFFHHVTIFAEKGQIFIKNITIIN